MFLPSSRWMLAFVAIVLLSGTTPGTQAGSVSFTLHGSVAGGWGLAAADLTKPGPTLAVDRGDSVTITAVSEDGAPHRLHVDYDGDGVVDADEPATAAFTSQATLTFAADRAGSFTYRCALHPAAMQGTLSVRETGSTPTAGGDNTLLYAGIVVAAVVVAAAVLVLRRR